ncbi:MAG: hypothetical protein JAZ06_09475 [Candidatus Thiodiazotropha taylori]|nr:hypothetical protein [Candidatus Thiodiazotropha taylori]
MCDNDTIADIGTGGVIIELDETYISHDKNIKPKGEKKSRGHHHKYKMLPLLNRGIGRAKLMGTV